MKVFFFIPAFILLLSSCSEEKKNDTHPATVTPPADNPVRTISESAVNPYAIVDVSPMDISYFPVDYPKLKMTSAINTPPLARVIYSRPHLQGRHVFHDVLKYGEPWRLGANESTELELFSVADILGKKIEPGRYTLYCIPGATEWTIILNSNIDTWGLKPDPSKDITRFIVPVITTDTPLEYFTMVFQKTSAGADLLIAWDMVEVKLPFRF